MAEENESDKPNTHGDSYDLHQPEGEVANDFTPIAVPQYFKDNKVLQERLKQEEAATSKAGDTSQAAAPELGALNQAADNFAPKPGGAAGGKPGLGGSAMRRGFRFAMRHKKATSAIGGLLAGGGILSVFGFSLLLPLKLDYMLSRLDTIFGATSANAMTKMSDNLMNKYVAKYVLPGIKTGMCRSTAEITCVKPISGGGPVAQLYEAWRQNHLETKLAKNYGIIFGKRNGQLYMAVAGKDELTAADLAEVMAGDKSIFEVGKAVDVTLARAEVRKALKSGTLWDRVFTRFKFGKLLEEKYGIRRCLIACKITDKFLASIAQKKLAAKASLIDFVVSPISERYGLILQCVVLGTGVCGDSLQPNSDGTDTQLTDAQGDLQQSMRDYITNNDLAPEALDAMVEEANNIADKGIANMILVKLLAPMLGETAAESFAEAASVVGLIVMAVQIAAGLYASASTVGPLLRHMDYAVNAVAAAKLFMQYRTVDSEMKSGHVDATELGSFSQALSTNVTGTNVNVADATTSPLYGSLFGTNVNNTKTPYKCNDGSQVPNGQLLCPEEQLTHGNSAADFISNATNFLGTIDPVLPTAAKIVNGISGLVNKILGWILNGSFDLACHAIDAVTLGSCSTVTSDLGKKVGQLIGQFSNWLMGILIPSPFSDNMSGGRTFDMLAAGADVTNNKVCQVQLGCAKQSDQKVAAIRAEELNNAKLDFQHQPLFAQLFSTSTPYSLVMQVAAAMPASLPMAANDVSSMLSNPFAAIAHTFSSVFASDKAFAASPPAADPFGVIQYGYDPNAIPSDPEAYWNQNCQGKSFAADWENSQQQDDNTGEAYATTTEPCLLIQSMVQSNGGAFDTSLLPANSFSSTSGSGSGGTSGCSGNTGKGQYLDTNTTAYPGVQQMCQRAQQISDHSSALFQQWCQRTNGCQDGWCEFTAAFAWGYNNSGYGSALDDWKAMNASGHAHPGDMNPPLGALLFYDNGGPYGHVTVYTGNNTIFGSDLQTFANYNPHSAGFGNASTAGWSIRYLGWTDPLFTGVKAS